MALSTFGCVKSISIFITNDLVTDQRMQRIAGALLGMGWSVTLFGRLKKKSKPLAWTGYKVVRVNTIIEQGVLFYGVINLIFFIKALFSRSSVLYSVDLDTLPAVRLAAYLRNKILVWDCHEIFPYMPELYARPFKQRVWKTIEHLVVPGLKHVLTVTTGVASYLNEHYGIVSTIVHNYPYTIKDSGAPDDKLKSNLVLFQGAINEGRCLEVLIRSFQYVYPPLQLIIAGDGPLKKELEFLSESMGLSHRIKFTGELNPDELKKLTDQARIGISLLNKEHQNSWISLANKNLDYIMAGLPSITVDFPEYKAINRRWQVATLLSDTREHTISVAVNQLYADHEYYSKLRQNCLKARQELCWEKEVGVFRAFIEKLPVQVDGAF